MLEALRGWAIGALALGVLGCSSSREAGPPRLARSVTLAARVERFAVGSRGTFYCTTSEFGPGAAEQPSGLQVLEAGGGLAEKVKLEAGVEVKAVASDERGMLYLAVKEGGKDQVWVVREDARGEKVQPQAKPPFELPGGLNGLFLGREAGVLYLLCGDNWVVKAKTDGSVVQRIELPGDSRPEEGGEDAAGNVYIRRSSGPVVKIKPDGTLDQDWAKSAAAGHDSVQSLAVDSRGIVYIGAYEGDIRLRGYTARGALAFNVVAEALDRTPERMVVTRDDAVYALLGQKMLVLRP